MQQKKAPQITLEPATPKDARGIAEVFYRTWLATYPNEEAGITVDDVEGRFKDTFTEEGLARRAATIAQADTDRSCILAKDGDRVIGVCNVARYPDKNQLQAIYVVPEYQRKGVGALLWQEAQKHFDEGKDTIVQVVVYNKNAIEFYRKLGFKDTGKQWRDDRFVMKSGAAFIETELVIEASSSH